MNNLKEVLFAYWCYKCEHCDKPETDDPCNSCLAQGWNVDSTKPFFYKEKEEKNGSNNGELH